DCSAEHLSLADGLEGVGNVLDLRLVALIRPEDRDDVEPAADLEETVLAEEIERGERDPALLLRGDRLPGHSPASRLDLDEDEGVAIARDQVNLAEPRAVAPDDHSHPLAAEVASGRPLAAVAQPAIPERPHEHERSHGEPGPFPFEV